MANETVVGTLRAVLIADGSQFEPAMRKAGKSTDATNQSIAGLTGSVTKLAPQAERMVKALGGDKLLYTANNLVAAVTKIGGAHKLTEAEQAKANRTLADAIAKYTALGRSAPAAMVTLEQATRRQSAAVDRMVAGLSAAGRAASPANRMLQGMADSGRAAAAALERANRPLGPLAAGMSRAGKEASASGRMIVGMGAAGRVELQRLTAAGQPIDPMLGAIRTQSIAVGAALGTFIGGVGVSAVTRLVGSVAQLAREGAELKPLETAFQRLAGSIGQSGAEMLAVARTATKGLISDLDLMATANKAILLGLPVTAEEMGDLARVAVTLGKAMRRDATESFDTLVTAIGRSSPLLLDNLGLVVKIGEANEAYASRLRVSVDQLSEADQKMAFYVATMEAARKKTAELGGIELTAADRAKQLHTEWQNMVRWMGSEGNDVLTKFINLAGRLANPVMTVVNGPAGLEEEIAPQRKQILAGLQAPAMFGRGAGPTLPQVTAADMKAIEARSAALLKEIEIRERAIKVAHDQRTALEQLGIVTSVQVTTALKEFADLEARAVKEGVLLDAVLVALAPKYYELAQQAIRSGVGVDAATAALERSRAAVLRNLDLEFAMRGLADAGPFFGEITDELRAMTPEATFAATQADALRQAYERFGITTREQLRATARQAEQDYRRIVAAVGVAAPEAREAYERMVQAQIAASGRLPSYWEDVIRPRIQESLEGLSQDVGVHLTDMLVGLQGFRDGFVGIWRSIRQRVSDILGSMVSDFIGGYLRRLAGAATGGLLGGGGGGGLAGTAMNVGASFAGQALGAGASAGGALAISAGVGGALPGISGATLGAAQTAGIGVGTAGTAGGGMGATLAGLATNPITIGIAAGALLTWGIAKKGWFRGGWEGVEGNERRDKFIKVNFGNITALGNRLLQAFMGKGMGYPAAESQRRALIDRQLNAADSENEFMAAQRNIARALAPMPVKLFNFGGFVPPGATVPAVLHGGGMGEIVLPIQKLMQTLGGDGKKPGPMHVEVHNHIQTIDAAGVRDFVKSRDFIDAVVHVFQVNHQFIGTSVARTLP